MQLLSACTKTPHGVQPSFGRKLFILCYRSRGMQVEVIDSTLRPDHTICRAARGDYMTNYIGDMTFDDIMEPVQYSDNDYEWAEEHLKQYGNDFEFVVVNVAKERAFMRKLAKRGHFGPFEHASMTFAVEGVSRALMAQLTRHRQASFDVQSFRYTVPDRKFIEEISNNDRPLSDMKKIVVIPPSINKVGVERHYLVECLINFEDYFHYLDELMDAGYTKKLAAQDARFILPQGTKCNLTFTVNIRSLFHIADMRAAGDAQWEIRDLTTQVLDEAEDYAPVAMSVYKDFLEGRKNRLAP